MKEEKSVEDMMRAKGLTVEDTERRLVVEKCLTVEELLKTEHELLGDTLGWAMDDEKSALDGLNYIFGAYDLVSNLIRKMVKE